jgi:uncharacterized membrane protein
MAEAPPSLPSRVIALFRRSFIAGLVAMVPAVLTLWLLVLLVGWIDALILVIPKTLGIEHWFVFRIPGVGVVIAFFFICLVGFMVRNYLGSWLLKQWNQFIPKVPILGTVYNSLSMMVNNLFGSPETRFNRVVMVPYPMKGLWGLGFVTNEKASKHIQTKFSDQHAHVFIPTAPNPTSGFFLVVPKSEIVSLDMPVDEAFKIIVSGGIISN